jgi:hypothetical protein
MMERGIFPEFEAYSPTKDYPLPEITRNSTTTLKWTQYNNGPSANNTAT